MTAGEFAGPPFATIAMARPANITVVIPAFDESESLSTNLPGWIQHSEIQNWDLIIVDDGSIDNTKAVLENFLSLPRLRILRHPRNRGYGAALKTGISQAATPYVATMDADGQHAIEQIGDLYRELISNRVDMVIGSRPASATRDRYRRLGKAAIRRLTRLLFATDIRDLNSGMRIYKTNVAKEFLSFCPDSMAFSDIIALLHLNTKAQVLEVPVTIRSRTSGRSTINTITAIDTVLEIINIVMWFRPLRVLLPISGLLMFAGGAWALPFLLAGRGLSGVALLLMLSGFQLGVLALLAEQLSTIRRRDLPGIGFDEITPLSSPQPSTSAPKDGRRGQDFQK